MIIMVLGLPGTGKSTFAKALAERLDAHHINSDMVRDELGLRGKYSEADKWKIYERMRKDVLKSYIHGGVTIIDATFYKKEIRDYFTNYVLFRDEDFYFIQIVAHEKVVQVRLKEKRKYSEADFKVHLKVKDDFEPLTEQHLRLDSGKLTLDEMVDKAVGYIGLA